MVFQRDFLNLQLIWKKSHDFQEDGPVNKTEKTENLSESKIAFFTLKVSMVYLLIKNESICPILVAKVNKGVCNTSV